MHDDLTRLPWHFIGVDPDHQPIDAGLKSPALQCLDNVGPRNSPRRIDSSWLINRGLVRAMSRSLLNRER
jgi:hypothetical protein